MSEKMVDRIDQVVRDQIARLGGIEGIGDPDYARFARAIIEAMRVPTWDMWQAGLKRHCECRVESAKGLYMVMIEEALK